jgi:hypothetical protein
VAARSKPSRGVTTGNFVAEWFGHRVWPKVDSNPVALQHQSERVCPFLSSATGFEKRCIKISGRTSPTGVCTISSDSNGPRQDWLACPYRTLDEQFTLLGHAIRLRYAVPDHVNIRVFSGEKIKTPEGKAELAKCLKGSNCRAFVFMADKLGGEIDLAETDASPGAKVDVSVVEVLSCDATGMPSELGQHLIYEIQTADFHGSPLHAVKALEELCIEREANETFHEVLSKDVELCGIGVEGPNKSNVFKRTFYQAVLKIQLAQHESCAGFVLVIPASVWSSWMRHLGNPELRHIEGIKSALLVEGEDPQAQVRESKSWIFVFDIDQQANVTPHPLVIKDMVAVSAKALEEHAFVKAVNAAFRVGVIERYRAVFSTRIRAAWLTKKTS